MRERFGKSQQTAFHIFPHNRKPSNLLKRTNNRSIFSLSARLPINHTLHTLTVGRRRERERDNENERRQIHCGNFIFIPQCCFNILFLLCFYFFFFFFVFVFFFVLSAKSLGFSVIPFLGIYLF